LEAAFVCPIKMIKILDTTLRDGSYVTNFQFCPKDTAIIARTLDEAGIPFIEAGHGLGMNAGNQQNMKAPFPDEAYLEACQDAVTYNKWGMFFIPGIGRIEDIELAAKYKMDFVRIGTNVSEVGEAELFIRRAKELGLYVASNLMKTYALSESQVAIQAAKAKSFGVDIVCVVDSAGGMLTEDLDRYITAIRKTVDIDIGFHGHNNLGLGVSNALRAVELGCTVVDTSVRGLGRSSGNTVTEMFLLAMKRKGFDLGIDITRILDLAETKIDSLLENYKQIDSIGIVSGYAQFHSAFLGRVKNAADRHKVDLRELIIRVSEADRIDAPIDMIESIAVELARNSNFSVKRKVTFKLPQSLSEKVKTHSHAERAHAVAKEVQRLAKKNNTISVFNIVQSFRSNESNIVSHVINESGSFVIGSAEISDSAIAKEIGVSIDGEVEHILLDIDIKLKKSAKIRSDVIKSITKSHILYYSDLNTWSDAVIATFNELSREKIFESHIHIIGKNKLSKILFSKCRVLGYKVSYLESVESLDLESRNALIYCERAKGRLPNNCKNLVLIDALVGSFTDEEVELLNLLGTDVFRIDMPIHIVEVLRSLINVNKKFSNFIKLKKIEGVDVTADGLIAPRGTVVLNSLTSPSKVLGIANGSGYLIREEEIDTSSRNKIELVEAYLLSKILGDV